MKKKNSLDKFERIIIGIGCLLIVTLIVLGILKQQTEEVFNYKSVKKEERVIENNSNDVKLLSDTFIVKQNGNLSKDSIDYFDANVEQQQDIELDFSEVEMDQVGTYSVKATYKNKNYNFNIKVEESENPTITAENKTFRYFIGKYSSMDEVKELAGVTAIDKDGNDLTEDIMGWEENLPTETGKKEYRLSVIDNYGNTGYLSIIVDFQRVM